MVTKTKWQELSKKYPAPAGTDPNKLCAKGTMAHDKFLKMKKELEKYCVNCKKCKEEFEMNANSEDYYFIMNDDDGYCIKCAGAKQRQKAILLQEKAEQELASYKTDEINWIEADFYKNWDILKGHTKKLLGHHEDYDKKEENKICFIAHSKDLVRGKPQLVEQVQKKIPLIKLYIKRKKEGSGKNKIEYDIKKIFTIGERVDERSGGYLLKSVAVDFWLYRIISEEGKEYYIFTQQKLPNCTCNFSGMLVELDDFAEFSRSMKIKSLSRMFFMKEFEPDIKILTKEQLINLTKEMSEEDWFKFLGIHKLGTINTFPKDAELLKSSFILSGKVDEYPLHLVVLGTAGTRKTMGYMETTAYKFSEEPDIIEGGDSRIKGLSPSFKEKPANIGYLAKQERMGFIDEIGKMLEFECNKHDTSSATNLLGELNFLLEHKLRLVGSGNDNDCRVQATAKFMFVTNPVKKKRTIYEHVGLIDATTMSRIFWWVQDDNEVEHVLGGEGIIRHPPTPKKVYTNKNIKKINHHEKFLGDLFRCRGDFISLFDTCYGFMCKIEDKKVNKLADTITNLAKEPMKSSVWKPRCYHHVKLLIDGLVKHRCLFVDHDAKFTAKKKDYDLAERILIRMVKGWDTNLSPKEEFR